MKANERSISPVVSFFFAGFDSALAVSLMVAFGGAD
jgi:hypothetical protein